jgi:hypothetical protein
MKGFFWFQLPHPSGNSSFGLYLSLKKMAFVTPLLLGIFNNPPWGGYGNFLEC